MLVTDLLEEVEIAAGLNRKEIVKRYSSEICLKVFYSLL